MSSVPQVFSDEVGMMNATWCVNPDRPVTGNSVVVFIKRCVRKLIRFFVVPNVEAQNDFNGHVTRAFNALIGEMRKETGSFESVFRNMPVECMGIFVDILNNSGKYSGGIINENRY